MLLFIKGILGAAMGMVLKIIPEPGLLHVLAAGEFSLEEAKTTFLEILDAVLAWTLLPKLPCLVQDLFQQKRDSCELVRLSL